MALEKLTCPVSGSPLRLVEIEKHRFKNGTEGVKTGILFSDVSGFLYPIINCVPVMLTFPTPLTKKFLNDYQEEIAKLPAGCKLPDQEPMKGEKSVQKTFTEEWSGLGDDEFTFMHNDAELRNMHDNAFLAGMGQEEKASKKSVLNVGVGFGKETLILSEIFPNAKVYAIDLNLSVVQAGIDMIEKSGGRIFPVVASLFKIPFADKSFDHVHSNGVLHHTFSTKAAFESIEKKVAEHGSIFIWLYAHEDPWEFHGMRGFLLKTFYLGTYMLRPILSRSPGFFRAMIMHAIALPYHFLVSKPRGKHQNWKYSNTVHGLRDMFTPRYAHRHGWNEVMTWYEQAGYSAIPHSPTAHERVTGNRIGGVGLLGRKH